MADLITSARAKYNLGGAVGSANLTLHANESTTLDALISACSRAIRKYCGREFDSQAFDELHNGNGQARLLLRQYPILSIARVAYDPVSVLRIRNTSSSNQRATVAVTTSGLSLTRVTSGVASTDTSVTWATYTTLTAIAAAVNALGNGWYATVLDSVFAGRASADLLAVQGAFNVAALGGSEANLKLHLQELSEYDLNAAAGWLTLANVSCDIVRACPGWSGGTNFWRIVYTAGYATVPEDIQEACASWVALLFYQTKHDPLISNTVNDTTGSGYIELSGDKMPGRVKALIDAYHKRQWSVTSG